MADTAPQLTFPLIHLNGNSRESLLRDYKDALRAVHTARAVFHLIDFHARNYYPLPNGSYERAAEDHRQNYNRLLQVEQYLEAHVSHLTK